MSTKRIRFAAIRPYIERNLISHEVVKAPGKDYMIWGDGNIFPNYLASLSDSVPTLATIISGCTDYTCGDGVTSAVVPSKVNSKGQTLADLVRLIAEDYFRYGGFALQVIRTRDRMGIAELYHIPMQFLRTSKDADVFWYCEEWDSYRVKTLIYPAYMKDSDAASSVYYYRNTSTSPYPKPLYLSALEACIIERKINEFQLNSISNGFMGSYLINFNNGDPGDEIKDEIERDFNEKFSGSENAGRVVFSWNDSKDVMTTLQKLDATDFGERYKVLADRSRQQIYTAFRANPNLFGIPTENLGFSSEEYESAFKLFNRTMIRPAQMIIADTFSKLYGVEGAISITPFSLDGQTEKTVE